jgi:hypothetical protein
VNRRSVLALAGTAVLAATIAVTSIAVADNAGPTELRMLGAGAPAPANAMGGDPAEGKRAATDMRIARPIEYRLEGTLPELDGEHVAYRFVNDGIDRDRVARLADLLGVKGATEVTEWGDWMITGDDLVLTVSAQPGHPWYLSPKPVEIAPDQAVVGCIDDTCPAPVRPEGLPTAKEAETIGSAFLRKVGVDLARTTGLRINDGFDTWYLSAGAVVGDLPVLGMEWSVGVGPHGRIAFANGWLDGPARGDTYPLIGTTAAVDHLRAQWSALDTPGAVNPAILRCMDCPDGGPVEPFVHVLTNVHLAYQLLGADLVPSYAFGSADGEVLAFAIEDKYLDLGGPVDAVPFDTELVDPVPTGKG